MSRHSGAKGRRSRIYAVFQLPGYGWSRLVTRGRTADKASRELVMSDTDEAKVLNATIPALRLLFDSIANLPADDPVRRHTRDLLGHILRLLEGKDGSPLGPLHS